MEKSRAQIMLDEMGKKTLLGVAVGMESVIQMLDFMQMMSYSAEQQVSTLRNNLESGVNELKRDVPHIFVDDDA